MTAARGAARYAPDRERARELARRHNVVPVVHRYVEDAETPVSAFLKLRDRGPSFLLESAEQGGRLGRFSFLGFRPRSVLRWHDGELREWSGGDAPHSDERRPSSTTTAPDPYAAVAARIDRYDVAPIEGMPPLPFPGGAVGMFAYDLVRTVEPLGEPNPDPLGLPDLALMICGITLAFDHHNHQLAIIAHAFLDDGAEVDDALDEAIESIESTRARLRQPRAITGPGTPGGEAEDGPGAGSAGRTAEDVGGDASTGREAEELGGGFKSNMPRERFEANVARIVSYVRAGDAFQVVPSQRFSAPSPVEPFSIYRGLRAVNPSPYMYFLDFGEFQIAGASPEPLVTVAGRRVETRPIAGTYPRGADEEEDRRRAEELLADPKERAEHVMLVDLGRNDLGRVCEYGTVNVDELMVVETYSHVMHIVSRISGRLRAGLGAMDVLRSVLPAGTLSGAPKVRAMQIIDELEPVKRGSYGGAIGYYGFNGDLDTAIHIRTVVVKDGIAHVQAGGGTVADAKPDYEYRESLQKAKAIFKAVDLAAAHPEWP